MPGLPPVSACLNKLIFQAMTLLAGGRNDTESLQEQFLALKMVQRTGKRYKVPWELLILGVAVQGQVGNGFLAS